LEEEKMAYNDFFSNELVLKIIDDLGNDNAKLERVVNIYQDDITIYDHYLEPFNRVTGKGEDYILEILKNEYKVFYTYIHHLASESPPNSDIMVPVNLILYTMIKHFPRKLEKYFSLQDGGKGSRMAEMMIADYNETFNIRSYSFMIKQYFSKLRRHYVFHKDTYILYRLIKKIRTKLRYFVFHKNK
jgi:hypothetical protein